MTPPVRGIGVDHTTAPVALRERLAVDAHRMGRVLDVFTTADGCSDACVVSTCLRTEVYIVGDSEDLASPLSQATGVDADEVREVASTWQGPRDVADHLFRVASGLESLVIGESEILGQIRAAHRAAAGHGAVGPVLGALFQRAIAAGRRVRSETPIGQGSVSMPSLAVRLAERELDDLRGRRAVVLGTGEMARSAATHLVERDCSLALVSRRLLDRARELAERVGAEARPFDSDLLFADEADLIISATSASHTLVRRETVERLMERRGRRPLLIIDLAVPRDVDPGAGALAGCRLVNVDDLEEIVRANGTARAEAAVAAESIVAEEVEAFGRWWAALDRVPTIRALREHLEALRVDELDRARGMSDAERDAADQVTRSLVAKILHRPTEELRGSAADEGDRLVAAVRQLFGLGPPEF